MESQPLLPKGEDCAIGLPLTQAIGHHQSTKIHIQRYLHTRNTSTVVFYGAESCCRTSDLAMDMSVDRGVRMYSWYAKLSHRSSVLINDSCKPCSAAVVAAPTLKLCPAYTEESMPPSVSVVRSADTKRSLVNRRPSLNMKSGPGTLPRWTRYPNMAATGQRSLRVAPTDNVTPPPN